MKRRNKFINIAFRRCRSYSLLTIVILTLYMYCVSGYGLILDRGQKMEVWTRENKIYLYNNMKDIPTNIDREYSFVMTFSSYAYEERFSHVSGMTLELMFPPLVYSLMKYKERHPWTENYAFYMGAISDACYADVGVPGIIDMKEAGANVIFGVPCSQITISAGHYLKYWNLPLITPGSNDPKVADKDIYPTVLRLGFGYTYLGAATVEMFNAFKWKTASLLIHDYGLCKFGGTTIYLALKEKDIHVAEYLRMAEDMSDISDGDILQYLRNFRERARSPIMGRIMELVDVEGMNTPDYVYITYYYAATYGSIYPWTEIRGFNAENAKANQGLFQHVKSLTPGDMTGPDKSAFLQEMEDTIERDYPWTMNISKSILRISDSPYALTQYDIMQLYLNTFNECLAEGYDLRKNGTLMFEKTRNKIFTGTSGEVIMNDNADRIPNYWIWQLEPDGNAFTHFASIRVISEEGKRVQTLTEPYWGTADGQPPPSTPECGFRDELCPPTNNDLKISLSVVVPSTALILVGIIVSVYFHRRKKYEEELQRMTWKVSYENIQFTNRRNVGSRHTDMSLRSVVSGCSKSAASFSVHGQQIFTKIGILKGLVCAVKKILKVDFRPTRTELIGLKDMRDLNHENLNVFIGLCFHNSDVYILFQYCSKGSLQDILEHDDIKLDKMFKSSLINDLVSGMAYLHDSPLQSHGHLKSSNCLIDSRWTLKITDYGLNDLRTLAEDRILDDLWTAPELLRVAPGCRPANGTQEGDVYSFAIILQEILFRASPYFLDFTDTHATIEKIKTLSDPPFRPKIPTDYKEAESQMIQLMSDCWQELPNSRPDFKTIKKKLMHQNNGRKVNILDNMVAKLESYANNLEDIVDKRTEELVEEKKKTDMLLYRMLPSSVAEKLKNGQTVEPEMFEGVTIYFSDIVGFTTIASESQPMQIVDLLNDLYTLFDDVSGKYDVYKVETIGDAYMCVSGLPNRNGDRHAVEIANMSLDLRDCVKRFKIRHLPERCLMIRIGLHTGSCAAGVVGLTMPRYCLFGDTVNVASRMESNGEAMKIHISAVTHDALLKTGGYVLELRGMVELKGKGKMVSYWLEGKR